MMMMIMEDVMTVDANTKGEKHIINLTLKTKDIENSISQGPKEDNQNNPTASLEKLHRPPSNPMTCWAMPLGYNDMLLRPFR